jgi:hypothetical protein
MVPRSRHKILALLITQAYALACTIFPPPNSLSRVNRETGEALSCQGFRLLDMALWDFKNWENREGGYVVLAPAESGLFFCAELFTLASPIGGAGFR